MLRLAWPPALSSLRDAMHGSCAAMLLLGCLACAPAHQAPCGASDVDEGMAAFRDQTATRQGVRDLRVQFLLNKNVDEHFTATPDIQTNLGQVLDAQAQADVLSVQILLGTTALVDGEVRLAGSLSGTFVNGVDRCPFQRRFQLSQSDATGAVTVSGLDPSVGL